jgi:hypothetical protein
MAPEIGFASALGVTVVLLVFVAWTGHRAKRRAHLVLVAAAVVALVTSIVFAKRLGAVYDLTSAGWITPFHLGLAKVTTACYLLPVVTGVATLRNARARPWHARTAWLVLALTVFTTVTGAWMLLASTRLG